MKTIIQKRKLKKGKYIYR